ncbi:unnamed protein product [Merluccius merluccius]
MGKPGPSWRGPPVLEPDLGGRASIHGARPEETAWSPVGLVLWWSGLSSDLVIEQTLIRSLKSSGGWTHGSGMTEDMQALWTMSTTPITSEYNNAMQEFNDLTYTTSEQH